LEQRQKLSLQPLYFLLECKAMAKATISSKNQVVIPREIRQALGVKAGDTVLFIYRGGRVVLLEKPKSYAKALKGLMKGRYPEGYLEKERASWD
jgi:AbrB family looped-hinge helix DNA binding protein